MWILHFCMFATNELIANAILILIQHFRFLNKDWVYVDIALLYVCHQWVDCQCYTNINSTFFTYVWGAAERKTSLGREWHPSCLKCKQCGKVLSPGQHAEVSDHNMMLRLQASCMQSSEMLWSYVCNMTVHHPFPGHMSSRLYQIDNGRGIWWGQVSAGRCFYC